jgi:imidazolonepropionase-like amidohydrolase
MRYLAFLIVGALLLPPIVDAQTGDRTVIIGATLIDGTGRAPIQNSVIVLEGPRIVQTGPAGSTPRLDGARTLDAQGKFVIPGLADMHNHLGDGFAIGPAGNRDPRMNLPRLLALGFTTIHVTGGVDPAVAASSREDAAPVPRVWGVGVGRTFSTEGGHLWQTGPHLPKTPKEARDQVRSVGPAGGVDAIKIMYSDQSHRHPIDDRPKTLVMKPEILQALIDEAHQRGMKAYVHAPTFQHARDALLAGADVLVHSVADAPVDAEFITLMKKNRATYITTLALYTCAVDADAWIRRLEQMDDHKVVPDDVYQRLKSDGARQLQTFTGTMSQEQVQWLRANLRTIHDAGIPVLAGTDTSVFGVLTGVSSQMELELMVEAGLTPAQVLRSATVNPAIFLGREKEQGTVEAGKVADLLILDADPLADVRNTRKVHWVIKGGTLYNPVQLLGGQLR